ncbi:hypothetical protein [Isoptericola sp. NPDC056134]|uniref:hypothetical protein n=1 Tax=Isoptericola sp. NPDC056134 TaxID=3345723 RepID=UPI0035EF71F7
MADRGILAYATVAAAGLLGLEVAFGWYEADATTALVAIFYGTSPDGFTMLPYLYLMIVSLGLATVLHAGFVHGLGYGLYAEVIRFGSVGRWLGRYLGRSIVVASVATVGLLVLHLLLYGLGVGWTTLFGSRAPALYGYFVVAGVVQTMVYVLLLMVVTLASGRTAAGLPVVGLVLVCGLPPLFRLGFLPVGLNSLSIPWSEPGAVLHEAVVLAVWAALLLVVGLGVVPRRRDLSFS